MRIQKAAQTFPQVFLFFYIMNIVVLETVENATVVFIYALFCLHVIAVVALVSINALPRDTFVY
jgi:ABC-type proline/glycine betaine transport system permease subunit